MDEGSVVANPFVNYDTFVYGDRFVGRRGLLRQIDELLSRNSATTNVALVGPPKIGKSSLAWHCIVSRRDTLMQRGALVCWMPFGRFRTSHEAVRGLIMAADRERRRAGVNDSELRERVSAIRSTEHWEELTADFDDYFFRLATLGWRTIFVLDEFDHARHVFRDDAAGFQALREPGQNPDYNVRYLTCSRRPLVEIEKRVGRGLSDFYNIFKTINVPSFDDAELLELASRVPDGEPSRIVPWLRDCAAGHPYLSAQLLYWLAEQPRRDEGGFDAAWRASREAVVRYYDDLTRQLEEQENFRALQQILFGPVIDVTQNEAEDLVRYGVLQRRRGTDDGQIYESFSQDYEDYLRLVHRERPLWPLWSETETDLRAVVSERLAAHYKSGDFWPSMVRAHQGLAEIVERAEALRRREARGFAGRASPRLIDYTYPQDIWAIIAKHWTVFVPVFGRDKGYWSERFALISKVRAPLAHNRDSLAPFERGQAVEYLEELRHIMRRAGRAVNVPG